MSTVPRLIQIHADDNVAVAAGPLAVGDQIDLNGRVVAVPHAVPAGHKVALESIGRGSEVRKYGCVIGRASSPIGPGEHVHSHNLETTLQTGDTYTYTPQASATINLSALNPAPNFLGYRRSDGRVGTRNEVWILGTVGCMNSSIERIARLAEKRFPDRCDGIFSFTHPFGCSQLGDDLQHTRQVLAGLARNPNAGGVLIVGLGCENNQMTSLLAELGAYDPDRIRSLVAQEVDDEIEKGVEMVSGILDAMASDGRESCPVSDLVFGVKCGGSDGFSGITANPTVGRVVDIHCHLGGRVLMTEVPEMFGAERMLMDRAVTEKVFRDIVDLVDGFKAYFVRNGQEIYENPSPGNRDGGLTTLEEKSLGAIEKGGRAPVTGVLPYGVPVSAPSGSAGLCLINAPGNDAVSSTALAAAGASLILFTTGRGTPLGVAVPTLKIASNSDVAVRKAHWTDFDCGRLLDGTVGFEPLAEALYDEIISVASGSPTRNEINGYREIAIWKEGVTL